MSLAAVTNTFVAGAAAKAADVNQNFADCVTMVTTHVHDGSGSAAGNIVSLASGTKMVFYQAAAPTGWTAVAVNDKFLRVVTAGGTGGTTGGTVAASTSLAHTHTVVSHDHTVPQAVLDYAMVPNADASSPSLGAAITSSNEDGAYIRVGAGGAVSVRSHYNRLKSGYSTGAATPATDSQLGAFAYADIIIASKD